MRASHRLFLMMVSAIPLSAMQAQTPAAPPKRPPVIAMAVRASLFHVQPTVEQQTKIKAIVAQQRPRLVVVRDSMKPWAEKLRVARQQHDTAAAREARVALRRGRLAIASVTRQTLLQIRPELTATQQAQFDTNLQRVKPALTRFVRRGRRPG
ncbi:MAG TPA: hypothetical protein VF785_13655 [Gemmatimonadaceae bacterium]